MFADINNTVLKLLRFLLMDTAELIASAKHTAGLLKLMSNENRLMILCTLINKEMSVSELNDHIPLSQSALSQHLAVLRKEEVVTTRRESQTIYYRLNDPRVESIIQNLYNVFCQPD